MILTVLYPAKPGARFDFDYYTSVHMPLVREVMAPASTEVSRGVGALGGGEPPFVLVCNIGFASKAAMDAAVAAPRIGEVFADVANFTDIAPITLVSEAVA